MKASEIVVGRLYKAKVSGELVNVLVLEIGKNSITKKTYYVVENQRTGRKLQFKSAQRFRSEDWESRLTRYAQERADKKGQDVDELRPSERTF